MAKVSILAWKKKPAGVFTQKKLLWEAMEKVMDEDELFIGDKEATYNRLCTVLRKEGKVKITDDIDTAVFQVWDCVTNELMLELEEA